MIEPVTIREARPDDVDAIAEVHVEGWRWGYRDLLPADKLAAIDVAARRALWERVVTGEFPDADVFVAERAGRVVGFVAEGPSRDENAAEDEGEIYAVYVRESEARRGTGRALLVRALDALRERGAGRAILWVLASSDRAQQVFTREGFRTDGGERTEPWEGIELREVRYRIVV